MKTLFKILLFVVAALVICVIAGVAFLYLRYPNVPAAESITIQATPERLTRGLFGGGPARETEHRCLADVEVLIGKRARPDRRRFGLRHANTG